MQEGYTFKFHGSRDDHLWVVISDPLIDADQAVVIVSFTSYREDKDQTCILQPGEHPFIRKRTIVYYEDAREVPNAHLEGLAATGMLVRQDDVAPQLLAKIRQGAAESKRIPLGCRKILAEQGLIE